MSASALLGAARSLESTGNVGTAGNLSALIAARWQFLGFRLAKDART
mgnify:CR=1 FL=1